MEPEVFFDQNVFIPAFFEKMAQHGLVPRTEAEASQLLDIGRALLQRDDAGLNKSAGQNQFLSAALQYLQVDHQAQPATVEQYIHKTAAEFSAQPQVQQYATQLLTAGK